MPRSTIWAVPHPSPELLRYHDLGQNHGLIRMVPLDCNKPKITGYSALFHHRIMKIHAHTSNKDLRCYSTEECHGQWTYFPIDEDELVIAIWHCRFQMTPSDILLVSTITSDRESNLTWIVSHKPGSRNGHRSAPEIITISSDFYNLRLPGARRPSTLLRLLIPRH